MTTALKRYLYFTAAITGAAILIVEILGAKMLSPYVGTSHFVWTAQIATTLLALASGYLLGGWLVDRSPKLNGLYFCILLAAVYLAITIAICEPVAYLCLKMNLALGAFCASALLFFVPLTLLATVVPYLVRILAISLTAVGIQIGKLSAVSTLGSVIGTVLIGYVLLPFLPNSITMYILAALLMGMVAAFYLVWGKKSKAKGAVYFLAVTGLGVGLLGIRIETIRQFPAGEELYRANSNFGLLQVFQSRSPNHRFYLNDYLVQNTYDPIEHRSNSLFTYMLHELAKSYTTNLADVLCIGLGVGIVPMNFARDGAHVDVVEINPGVVKPGSRFFDLDPSKLNLTFGDGRQFVGSSKKTYDAVILDAFLGDSSPSHLMTREAFASVRRILRPGGVLVINSFGEFEEGHDFFMGSLSKTLKKVFGSVRIHASGNGNVFFVATEKTELTLLRTPEVEAMPRMIQGEVKAAYEGIREINPASGMVLTDDYNPIEYYDAQNRESYRRRLALSMRE